MSVPLKSYHVERSQYQDWDVMVSRSLVLDKTSLGFLTFVKAWASLVLSLVTWLQFK